MTSELHTPLTLADLIDKEFMGVEPDSQCVVLDDADWKMITAALRRYTIELTRCVNCDGHNCDDGCAYPDTRAVPDMSEMVQMTSEHPEFVYVSYEQDTSSQTHDISVSLEKGSLVGVPVKYVRYDQAAAVIAAKDEEIERLKDENRATFNTYLDGHNKNVTLEAKLAQSEKQKALDGFLISDGVAYLHEQYGEGLFFSDDALKPIYVNPIQKPITQDVINLVIAGRELAYGEGADISSHSYNVLDKALEAFASDVLWENEPDEPAAPNQQRSE